VTDDAALKLPRRLEHVVPKFKGGPAWPENEVAACRGCNRSRAHVAASVWMRDCVSPA
jgi:5-methylcytosine-specific restriction endonuclease McrA